MPGAPFNFATYFPKPKTEAPTRSAKEPSVKPPAPRKAKAPGKAKASSRQKAAKAVRHKPAATRNDGMSAHDLRLVAFSQRVAAARRADVQPKADKGAPPPAGPVPAMSVADRRLVDFAQQQAEARRNAR